MTKSRERPIAGASRRSRRAQSAWNVDTHMPVTSEPSSDSTRARISSAALLVKVTASTSCGFAWPSPTRYAMRLVMTRVLPEPAPARMRRGPLVWRTASRCSGLSVSKNCMGIWDSRLRIRDLQRAESRVPTPGSLFYRDALGEVPRLIDVAAAADGDIVREQLKRDDHDDRR